MLVVEYSKFVRKTVQYADKSPDEQRKIALYGLIGEIGSLLSAAKKQLLAEGGETKWNAPSEEILEELGDTIWYGVSLAQIINVDDPKNILKEDIRKLVEEVEGDDEKARKINEALGSNKIAEFLSAARALPSTEAMTFDDYQKCAFHTARTQGPVLMKVCLAVLWQLGAELLRTTLPEVELDINKSMGDREPNIVLGEIAWHLAAVATLFEQSLNDVVRANVKKVGFRSNRSDPTGLHDVGCPIPEQLPRTFDIVFLTVGKGRARMYCEGRQLGDELTDNSYHDDGYRFHDVMHLANAAYLGWSPVLRSLLRKKRKGSKEVDEVEDGARAMIVEELVIKAIHAEGGRIARAGSREVDSGQVRLFPSTAHITFGLLRHIREYTLGLEVHSNKYWEWENAIFNGARVFHELCQEGQGTVSVDLEARTLGFRPEIEEDISGSAGGMGSALVDVEGASNVLRGLTAQERKIYSPEGSTKASPDVVRVIAAKQAVLRSVGIGKPSLEELQMVEVTLLKSGRVSIKTSGAIREEVWRKRIVSFTTTLASHGELISCTALAISDPGG